MTFGISDARYTDIVYALLRLGLISIIHRINNLNPVYLRWTDGNRSG